MYTFKRRGRPRKSLANPLQEFTRLRQLLLAEKQSIEARLQELATVLQAEPRG